MSAASGDHELLSGFAQRGDEAAFRTLVHRHTSLVFATALRILQDHASAEEVVQNVFIALARKARSIPADLSLPAWLHRAAVLEARNHRRGEFRRRQREELAGAHMIQSDESVLQALTSVLDEALLDLREKDRSVLLLRFIHQKDLKEVGQVLGISEDAAQKRVSKAVELLTRAFRRRGHMVSSSAITLSLLETAGMSAPVGLATASVSAALSAVTPAALSGIPLLTAKFMALTKVQTAALCLAAGLMPAGLQWQQLKHIAAENTRLAATLQQDQAFLASMSLISTNLVEQLAAAESHLFSRQAELDALRAQPRPPATPPEQLYRWSSQSDYVRLPKSVLETLRLTPEVQMFGPNGEPITRRGKVLDGGVISPVLLEALGLDANQTANVQAAFQTFHGDFESLVQSNTILTNAMPPGVGLARKEGAELVTIRTLAFPEPGEALTASLRDSLSSLVGAERTSIILDQQGASDLQFSYLNSGSYEKWLAAVEAPDGMFSVARATVAGGVSYSASVSTVPYEDLPPELKPHFPPPPAASKAAN